MERQNEASHIIYGPNGKVIRSAKSGFLPKVRLLLPPKLREKYKDVHTEVHEGEEKNTLEIEASIHVEKSELRNLKKRLSDKEKTKFLEEVKYDSVWYSQNSICSSFKDHNTQLKCNSILKKTSIRIRKATIKGGKVRHYWTLKIPYSSEDGVKERIEHEDYQDTHSKARSALGKVLTHYLKSQNLNVKVWGKQIVEKDLHVKKKRLSYLFEPQKVEEGSKCYNTQIDLDVITHVGGVKIDSPIYIVDVEGPSKEQIKQCAECLGLKIDPSFSLRVLLREKELVEN